MKVLMINHFPLEGSGSGTYTKNLATQLVKLGHEVCVILPENTADVPQYEGVRLHPVFFTNTDAGQPEAIDGALPFNFPCFTTHPVSTMAFDGLSDEQMEAYLAAFKRAIDEEVRDFAPDIVHGQHVWALSSLAVGCGAPLVLTAHGTDLMGYDKWPEMRHFAETAMDACAKVICISADNEQLVKQAFPQHADKIVRMRNGYNPDIFYPQSLDRAEVLGRHGIDYRGQDVILFAGKMTRFKGIDILVDAAATYESACPHALTVLAGDGEERARLEAQARDLGLERLHFIGNVAQDELARLYCIADIDLVPSRREPFGLVAVEAMACGTPVVATNQGGLPDFVNDEVGALVNPEDADDLARGIQATLARALADPAWRADIAAYASGNYSQAVIIRELDELYRDVVEHGRFMADGCGRSFGGRARAAEGAGERAVQVHRVYRHFKGDFYLVEDVARHSETDEELVLYRKLYGDGSLWARPKDMFLAEVNREKYPDADQRYRFELQDIKSVGHPGE